MIVSLTFDDGWRTQFLNAKPILDKYGFKATFYIITYYTLYRHIECYMNYSELVQLSDDAHEIGAHSATHLHLIKEGREEILQSKQDLDKFGFDVKSFAYPYAEQNAELRKLVRESGFKNARAGKKELRDKRWDIFAVGTFFIERDTTFEEFKEWFVKVDTGLAVIGLHQIQDDCDFWGCQPEKFEKICHYLAERGDSIEVLPFTAALERYVARKTYR